jgi:N-acetylmuramoyl-L-alanine amidase
MGKALLGMALALLVTASAAYSFEWGVKRIEGRDYSSLKKIAEFYNLPQDFTPEDNSIYLNRGRRSLRAIRDNRELEINGVKHLLSFPVIERDGEWWVSRMDLGKTIEPAFRPELIADIKPFTTVILDPGHGGQDKGAVGRYEVEKNFSLDVARRVRNELQKSGVNVLMTRNSDVFVELHDRAAIANAKQNAIFVSLHFNASPNAYAEGLEIFCITPRGSPSTEYDELLVRDMVQEYGNDNELQSFTLANAIYHSLHGSLKMTDRGVKRARFAVLRLSKLPSVLVEGGFLSNPNDARRIATKDWRDTYAKAIATGILEYRKLAEFKTPPRLISDYRNPSAPAATPVAAVAALPSPTPKPGGVTLRDLPSEAPENSSGVSN